MNITKFIIFVVAFSSVSLSKSEEKYVQDIQNYFSKIECIYSDFAQTDSDGNECMGNIFLLKKKYSKSGTDKVRIDYCDTANRRIAIVGNSVKIINLDENKVEQNIGLSQTPLSSILGDCEELSTGQYSLSDSAEGISLTLFKSWSGMTMKITLFFSKFENNNIKNLLGWVTEDPQHNVTVVKFIPDTFCVNDHKKVEEKVFDEK